MHVGAGQSGHRDTMLGSDSPAMHFSLGASEASLHAYPGIMSQESEDLKDHLRRRAEKEAREDDLRKREMEEILAMKREHDLLEGEALDSSCSAATLALKTQKIGADTSEQLLLQGGKCPLNIAVADPSIFVCCIIDKLNYCGETTESTARSAEQASGLAKDVEKYSHIFGIKFKNPWSKSRKERKEERDVYDERVDELAFQRTELEKNIRAQAKSKNKPTPQQSTEDQSEEDPNPTNDNGLHDKAKQAAINKNLDTINQALDNILQTNQDITNEIERQKIVMEQIDVNEEHIQFNIQHAEKKIRKYT